jgi:hypothetical protein
MWTETAARARSASYVLALFLAAAAVIKLVRIESSGRDLDALVRGLGLGRLRDPRLTWCVVSLAAAELSIAAALLSSRHRRVGLAAFLGLLVCGVVTVGIASRWGARRDFGCPCGLGFELPRFANAFVVLLLRDGMLVAIAGMAWMPSGSEPPAPRVRPA